LATDHRHLATINRRLVTNISRGVTNISHGVTAISRGVTAISRGVTAISCGATNIARFPSDVVKSWSTGRRSQSSLRPTGAGGPCRLDQCQGDASWSMHCLSTVTLIRKLVSVGRGSFAVLRASHQPPTLGASLP
jgi:hypothetical protein